MPPRDNVIAWVAAEIIPHEAGLRAWLRRTGAHASEIDDIVQQAYCKLSELDMIAHIHNPRAYFFATARSILLQRVRRDRVVPIHALADTVDPQASDDAPTPERTVGARLQLSRVVAAITALPAQYRQVVELRRLEGLSQKETAQRLGVSEKFVENHLARGLKAVLKAMETGEADYPTETIDTLVEARHAGEY